ncbi:TPA: pseudouridine synthase [Candidatus Bathyarchaeota archaeon]|nr:pseudouridine synthase [Candidatus Bathyarchaeota archaeon]
MKNNDEALILIRCIADYQFGKDVGEALFPDGVEVVFSKRTGKVKHIYFHGRLLATLRPMDGLFSLTVEGGERILKKGLASRMLVKVNKEAAPFIREGRNVFAKHVIEASEEIRPEEEVIVVDENCKLLAVGRAMLTGREMKSFRRGIAVRVRAGSAKSNK